MLHRLKWYRRFAPVTQTNTSLSLFWPTSSCSFGSWIVWKKNQPSCSLTIGGTCRTTERRWWLTKCDDENIDGSIRKMVGRSKWSNTIAGRICGVVVDLIFHVFWLTYFSRLTDLVSVVWPTYFSRLTHLFQPSDPLISAVWPHWKKSSDHVSKLSDHVHALTISYLAWEKFNLQYIHGVFYS